MTKISDEAKRLRIVYDECKKEKLCQNSVEFSALIGIDQSTYSRMSNGIYPITFQVVKSICYKLGFSAAWFINGEGKKKTEKEAVKLVTEIQMLRTEIDILTARLRRVEIRNGIDEREKASVNNDRPYHKPYQKTGEING